MTYRMLLLWPILVFCSSIATADTITGSLKFNKRPPFTGVLYSLGTGAGEHDGVVNQKNKQFTKKVVVVKPESAIRFENSDDFDHNVFANDLKNNVRFDVGRMVTGDSLEVPVIWKSDTIVRLGCKIHPKMRAYVTTVEGNAHQILPFEKSSKDYAIDLRDVAPEATGVKLLMSGYDLIEVDLGIGESVTVPLIKKGKEKGVLTLSRS